MPKLFDRVKVNIATTGNGTITFAAASSPAFLTPSEAGAIDGNTVRYVLVDGTDFEEGVGTILASVAQMSRDTVTRSKIGGALGSAKIALSGTAVLVFTASAADIVNPANNLSEVNATAARGNLAISAANTPATPTGSLVATNVQSALQELDTDNQAQDTLISALQNSRVRHDAAQSLSASAQAQARANVSAALKGHLFGLTMSNNATDAVNDIDIAAGEAASTEANPVLMVLASALTKRLDANWAVGNNQGGLDFGSIADVVYHVWLIQRSDTGVVDALFSTSATAPTMPANYDRKRRIGAIIRANAAIRGFVQDNDKFILKTPVQIANGANLTTTSQLFTLAVPTGIIVEAEVNALIFGSASISTLIQSPLIAAQTANSPAGNISLINVAGSSAAGQFRITTDTSGNIRAVSNVASGANFFLLETGWIDRRDRF